MKLALFAICVSLISSAVSAAAIKFTFEATVTNSDVVIDGDPIELGDLVAAVFRYDTNRIDFVGGSTFGFRRGSFEIAVDGHRISSVREPRIQTLDRSGSGGSDAIRFLGFADSSTSPLNQAGEPATFFTIGFSNPPGVFLFRGLLPPLPRYGEILDNAQTREGDIFFNPLSRVNFDITRATVEAIATVPLPAGALLLLSGVGGLTVLRRRNRSGQVNCGGDERSKV